MTETIFKLIESLPIVELLAPIVVAGLGWLSAKLSKYIESRTKNELLSGILVRLNDSVMTVVKRTQQEVVSTIKAAKADGRLSDVEKQQIKSAAMLQIKQLWGVAGLAELGSVLGIGSAQIDELLNDKIEAAVHDLKKDRG